MVIFSWIKKNYDVVEIDNIRNLRSYIGGKESIAHASIFHSRGTGTY